MATKWDGSTSPERDIKFKTALGQQMFGGGTVTTSDAARAADYQQYMSQKGFDVTNTNHSIPDYSLDTYSNNTAAAGGLGNFGTYTAADGTAVGLNEDAFNKVKSTQHGGTLTQNTGGFFGKDGFNMDSALGLGKLATGLGALYLANKQLGLAEDTSKFNKADRNRVYEANKQKYNNSLARTNAVNVHYGVANSGKML